MRASGGGRRFTAIGRAVLNAGPQWQSSRALAGSAAAALALLAVTGVVALSTTGSTAAQARDAAATTGPAKPHYLLPIAALVRDGAVPPPTYSGDNSTIGVPRGTAARPTTPAPTPAAGSGDITTYRGATGTMTPAGIATLALEHGCTAAQAPTATAVAMAESGGSPSAQGDVSLMTPVWDWSAGLWQIRGLRAERGSGALRDSVANQRAGTNAAAMYVISSGCTNWSAWTTYTRGSYLGYLGVAQQAVTYVLNYRTAHGHFPPVASPDPTAVIPVATGGGAAAPASASRSSVHPATPTSSHPARSSAAPSSPTGPAPSTAAGSRPGGGSAGGSSAAGRTRTATPSPTPSTSSKPVLPLPTVSLPVVSLPVLPPITLPPLSLP